MGFSKIYDEKHIARAEARKSSRAAKAATAPRLLRCHTAGCANPDGWVVVSAEVYSQFSTGSAVGTYVCESCTAKRAFGEFFVALAQFVAEQRAAEKKAKREEKKQTGLTILGRATFKTTGAVLFGIEDRNSKVTEVFHVTVIAGVIRSCVSATTGESCDGRRWSGHCCHEKRVLAYEEQRESELSGAAQVAPMVLGEQMAADLQAHLEDEMPAQPGPELPAVLRDGEGLYYVLTGDTYRVMSAHDLRQIGPYREGGESDRARLQAMLNQPAQDEHKAEQERQEAVRRSLEIRRQINAEREADLRRMEAEVRSRYAMSSNDGFRLLA